MVFAKEIILEDEISIIHFNCRITKANLECNDEYLLEIKSYFDAIALSESCLSLNNNLNHLKISNCSMFDTLRNDQCGGMAIYIIYIYIKQSSQCSRIKKFSVAMPMLWEQATTKFAIQGSKKCILKLYI